MNRLSSCLIRTVPNIEEAYINCLLLLLKMSKNILFRGCPLGVVLLKVQRFPPTLHYLSYLPTYRGTFNLASLV